MCLLILQKWVQKIFSFWESTMNFLEIFLFDVWESQSAEALTVTISSKSIG